MKLLAKQLRWHKASPLSNELEASEAPPPKPPPELPLCFMLSHVEDDGPVRLDGVKLAVTELMGLELDEARLGAFAGALNACDFSLRSWYVSIRLTCVAYGLN